MSSKRIVVSCGILTVAIVTSSWYVAASPMLQTPGGVSPAAQKPTPEVGPLEKSAKPITLENPIPRRTFSVAPQNPGDATTRAAVVTLRVVIDRQGRVGEVRNVNTSFVGTEVAGGFTAARGTSGGPSQTQPPAFAKAAIDAVRQWQYDPPADGPIAFDLTFAFAPGKEGLLVQHGDSRPMALAAGGRTGGPIGVVGGVVGAVPAPPAPPGWGQRAVRVGSNVPAPTKTKHVSPEYPAIAQSSRVQGVVIIEAIIGTDGHVQDARILRSIPLLDQAALDAVKQWEYTPTMLNGAPVPVIMTVTVQFTLT